MNANEGTMYAALAQVENLARDVFFNLIQDAHGKIELIFDTDIVPCGTDNDRYFPPSLEISLHEETDVSQSPASLQGKFDERSYSPVMFLLKELVIDETSYKGLRFNPMAAFHDNLTELGFTTNREVLTWFMSVGESLALKQSLSGQGVSVNN